MQFEVDHVSFRYPDGPWILKDVSLTLSSEERTALLGPSGYGKSTLAQIMSGYLRPTEGRVLWNGRPLPQKGYCPVQLIWQHPEQAVNPRWRMNRILNEAWHPDDAFLNQIGLEREWLSRWPIELSGGELQRFCIARALGPRTEFLIADEMSTMLDVITQAQIWNFVMEETQKRGMGLLVITHNRALADRVCTRVIELSQINHCERDARV